MSARSPICENLVASSGDPCRPPAAQGAGYGYGPQYAAERGADDKPVPCLDHRGSQRSARSLT